MTTYEEKRDRDQKRIDAFYEGWKSVTGRYPEIDKDIDGVIFSTDTPYMTVREAYRFGRRRARKERPAARTRGAQIHVRHLGIYSENYSPEENYRAGRAKGFVALTIGRQLNDAANLSMLNARKYSRRHMPETAKAFERAERAFREAAAYAFKQHASGVT